MKQKKQKLEIFCWKFPYLCDIHCVHNMKDVSIVKLDNRM